LIKRWFIWAVQSLIRALFRLRYRITYKGLDGVHKALEGATQGTLFLPNHPAVTIDPLISTFPIYTKYQVRPLVTEYMFYSPVFHWAFKLIGALSVPNFSVGVNPLKFSRLEKTLKTVEEGLEVGESFLIAPAGMTKASSREVLGGTFAVHQLLSKKPQSNVVLIRMTGLWGSRFSRAYTKGKQVNSAQAWKQSFWDLLKAGFFFLPRREVTVEFEMAPEGLPRGGTKQEVNRFLEKWYNRPFDETLAEGELPKGEPLTFVPYSHFGSQEPVIEKEEEDILEGKEISQTVKNEIIDEIAEIANIPKASITAQKYLVADLSLDSLNIAELITFLETRYDIKQIDPQGLVTVAHTFLAATGQLKEAAVEEIDWDTSSWEKQRGSERVSLDNGRTVPELFFDRCDKRLFSIAAADPIAGPVSYHRLKSRVMMLSHEIAKLPGRRIGILLPASVASTVLILACQLAGKAPVMINWTVGGGHLESVLYLSEIDVALTSWAFLDRLENVDLKPIQDILVILEEFKSTFSWWKMVTSPIKALVPSWILRKLGWLGEISKVRPDSEAVVLFTSGTESMPKGVPLTHANLLSNMKAALMTVCFYASDRLLSALPPFHSFGFAVTGLLPILSGVRVVFYPNPTDSGAQARTIKKWGVTIICSAPSFLTNILRQATKEPFSGVRLIVSGAEKAPVKLFEIASVSAPQAEIWEGYGITECSPVLTVNTTNDPEMGVGLPLPGVHLRIVHPEEYSKPLPQGKSGMILASGPNVFAGYLQADVKSPFYEEDTVRWYVTGDIGYLNEVGALIITGRLKRFVKIGGEMISLGAIETALLEEGMCGQGEGPQIAVCAKGEAEGRVRMTLFSTIELEVAQVNALLRKKGFSNLVRIDRVVPLEEIPVSGTGKVAYRQLETTIA